MKTLKCDLCEVVAEGASFDEWTKALLPHYMEAHADVIKNANDEEKAKWMSVNKERFDAA